MKEWPALPPSKTAPVTQWIGGLVELKDSMSWPSHGDKEKIPCPAGNQTPVTKPVT